MLSGAFAALAMIINFANSFFFFFPLPLPYTVIRDRANMIMLRKGDGLDEAQDIDSWPIQTDPERELFSLIAKGLP